MAQSHTPCNRCVRFATTVASGHATLATKRTLLLNLGRTSTGWIAPACGWRTHSITSSAGDLTPRPQSLQVDALSYTLEKFSPCPWRVAGHDNLAQTREGSRREVRRIAISGARLPVKRGRYPWPTPP